MKTKYCVYLTIYSGSKLPPFYIGYCRIQRIFEGYHGTVTSKKYKKIWNEELIQNNHMFRTQVLSYHDGRKEANQREVELQKRLNVIDNPLYINQAINKIYGGSFDNEQRQNMSISAKKRVEKYGYPINNLKLSWLSGDNNVSKRPEVRKKIVQSRKRIYNSKRGDEMREISRQMMNELWSDPIRRKRMSKKPEDTSRYREAALKRWANKEDREKRCASMRKPHRTLTPL